MRGVSSEKKDKVQPQDGTPSVKGIERFWSLAVNNPIATSSSCMISKEANSFTTGNAEKGNVNTHRLKTHLKDQVSVKKNYNLIPKLLYKEL